MAVSPLTSVDLEQKSLQTQSQTEMSGAVGCFWYKHPALLQGFDFCTQRKEGLG